MGFLIRIIMMLGSKGILSPMIHGLLCISCPRNPKNIRNPPYSGYFLMFYGSQSHAFSCKHETHNLLTLVSCHLVKLLARSLLFRQRYRNSYLCLFFCIKGKFSFRRTLERKMPAGNGHDKTDGD